MTNITRSNSLTDLAARIKAEHQAWTAAMKRGAQHAMSAGDLLIEAKTKLEHGQWLPWLKEHCAMSERTAQLYMRMARARNEIETKSESVADLSLRGAMAAIAPTAEAVLAEGMALASKLRDACWRVADVIEERYEELRAIAEWYYEHSPEERRSIEEATCWTRRHFAFWLKRDAGEESHLWRAMIRP